ncbi:Protein obstructor-E [Sergentomyia squamirostris]
MMQSTLLLLCCSLFALQVFGQFGQDPRFNAFNSFRNPPPPQGRVPVIAPTPAPVRSASCPESNGRYPLSGQCDAYIECRDGVAEQKLCPDGLLFNEKGGVFTYPCSYPIDVECAQGRQAIQPAQPTDECPHQFGYFRLGDTAAQCGQFMNCVDGRGFVFDCPEGLAFNRETYRCDWPDQVPDCDAEAFLGFTCPPQAHVEGLGELETQFYRSPHDCQHYFICLNGRPRLQGCGEGYAFNDLTNACDGIENVTSCYNPSTSSYRQASPVTLRPTPRPSNFRTPPVTQPPFSQRFSPSIDTRNSFFK